MPKCIYCLQDETETTFMKREHVIPQFFGTFIGANPVISGDIVCDACNSIFSPLEVNFLEDTMEGFQSQRWNPEGRKSISLRNKNLKIATDTHLENEFFDQIIFPLKMTDSGIKPYFKSQIKFKGLGGVYCRVFFPEALAEIKKDSRKFREISSDMKKLSQKDIHIFTDTVEELDRIILLLKDYGVDYSANISPQTGPKEIQLSENFNCTIDHDIGRVFAKIALNYFAYCCMKDGRQDVLFLENFDPVRKYVHHGEGKMKDYIVSMDEDVILSLEAEKGGRTITHTINFIEENDFIVVRMTFMGCPRVYKINLGKITGIAGIDAEKFGCGHLFDPLSKQIGNLTNNPGMKSQVERIENTFGINRRFG